MSESRTVAVVGAGVFGTTAALELRRRGHRVVLLDRGPLPHPEASSTDISKIVRPDYGDDVFYSALAEEAMEGWEEWNRRWGQRLFHPEGFLVLASGSMEPGGFEHESWRVLRERGHRLERMDPRTLAARHPAWNSERYPDGYFNPRAGWVESGRVMARLVEEAREAGVEIRDVSGVEGLLDSGSRVEGVRIEGGERIEADGVVVAVGAWTPSLLPWLGDVMWATGQPVIHFAPPDPAAFRAPVFPPWAADVARTGWYGFPAHPSDGRLKVGNHGPGRRVDPRGAQEVTTEEEVRFRAFFRESLPPLADAPLVERRLCLYCDTADGDFWIAPDPDREGLVVAAGGSGHGFKFAPVIGPLVADAVEGAENPRLERFRWRSGGEPVSEPARHLD